MKIVPLVVYEDGERKVVGEAVIENEGGALDISATVDSRFAGPLLSPDLSEVSIGSSRPCDGRNVNVCVAEGCYGEACLKLKE